VERIVRDIRYALAGLRRTPGFTATALTTLTLGIGGATAVFSIVQAVLLRPLPYPEPDRLVRLWEEHPGGVSPAGNRWLSRPTYAVWRQNPRTLDAIGGYTVGDRTVVIDGEPIRMAGSRVSSTIFGMLGSTAAVGRFFTEAEDQAGADRVIVLSAEVWRERFAARADILGRPLIVDGDSYTIVGVARPELRFPAPGVAFWIPYALPTSAAQPEGAVVFTCLARLKPGMTAAQAEAEGTAAARSAPPHRLTGFFFGNGGEPIVHARTLLDDMTVTARPALSLMAVAIGLVLLVACANVANLFLSRGVARQREMAIRSAIGASRSRLLQQLFTESTVLSAGGGLLGLWLAWTVVRALPAMAPARLPRGGEIEFDGSVAAFCAVTTMLAAILCGIAPALHGARAGLGKVLRSTGVSAGTGPRAARLRDGLLVSEAAIAVLLIVSAGLVTHSFIRLMRVDPGYSPNGVLIAGVELPRDTSDERTDQFIDATLERLRATTGITAAGAAAMVPLMSRTAVAGFTLPERLTGGKATRGRALIYWITPGYAEAVGLRLRDGRFLTAADARADRLPMLVNDEFVRQHLSTARATGVVIPGLLSSGPAAEIVGIVGNVLKDGNDRQPQPELYFAHGSAGQRITGHVNLVVRTTADPEALIPMVRQVVKQVEPGAALDRVEPLSSTVAASVDEPRFAVVVMTAFAGLGLVLTAVGLYGVLTCAVTERRRELGIRAALGARRGDLIRLVMREGLSRAVAGIGIGLIGALAMAQLMRGLLFGVMPTDGASFTFAPAVLIVTAALACLIPALRAGSTDPVATLRAE
jgi:predicted permease